MAAHDHVIGHGLYDPGDFRNQIASLRQQLVRCECEHREIRLIYQFDAQPFAGFSEADIPPQPLQARSEEPTSELQSLMRISYAVFCLTIKNNHHYRLSYVT